MIGDWFSGLMQEQARKSGAREVRRFVGGLRRMADRDLGVIVGIAAVVRVNMENEGILTPGLFAADAPPDSQRLGLLQLRLNHVAKQFLKMRQPADATGVMVWSYSLRCLNVPGLDSLGREMWAELARGFPHVEEALDEGEERNGRPFDRRVWEEWRRFPPGLEPDG